MHSHGLGIYTVVNAEGLLTLAKHMMHNDQCEIDEALKRLYQEFKTWCKSHHISSTQRRWTKKNLHTETRDGVQEFPTFKAKAFNARIILAWLADPRPIVKPVQACNAGMNKLNKLSQQIVQQPCWLISHM